MVIHYLKQIFQQVEYTETMLIPGELMQLLLEPVLPLLLIAADPGPCYVYKPGTDTWIAQENIPITTGAH